MSAWWTSLLLLAAPAGPPPPPSEPARTVRPASEQEHREAIDFAQLSLGEWVAARRELLRELEALHRRGRSPGAARKLEQWRAADLDAEVRHIQAGLNAARQRKHPR
jgi:hypothetical protein